MIDRRMMLGGMAALAAVPPLDGPVTWAALAAAAVRDEMRWAWGQYRERAWGKDQIRPVSGGSESFSVKDHHLGLSLIEAMDTLWVMGLDAEFADALGWVKAELSFDVDGEVSVFETIIRLVGKMLSAHHVCGDPALLALARDLANRMLPAFETPTGMPYRSVNLRTGAVRDSATTPAETGSGLLRLWSREGGRGRLSVHRQSQGRQRPEVTRSRRGRARVRRACEHQREGSGQG